MIDDCELHFANEIKDITERSCRIRGQYKLINQTINKVAKEFGLYYLCVTPYKDCVTIYKEGQKCIVDLSFTELLDYIPTLTEFGYEVKVYNNYICIFWHDTV